MIRSLEPYTRQQQQQPSVGRTMTSSDTASTSVTSEGALHEEVLKIQRWRASAEMDLEASEGQVRRMQAQMGRQAKMMEAEAKKAAHNR